jgi:hypothetical protein
MTANQINDLYLNICWVMHYWKFCVKGYDYLHEDPLKWGWKRDSL